MPPPDARLAVQCGVIRSYAEMPSVTRWRPVGNGVGDLDQIEAIRQK